MSHMAVVELIESYGNLVAQLPAITRIAAELFPD